VEERLSMTKVLVQPKGAATPVEVGLEPISGAGSSRYAVTCGEFRGEVDVEIDDEGSGQFHCQGRMHRFHTHRDRTQLTLWVDGRTYSFELIDRSARRSQVGQAVAERAELTAPMPGTVLKIRVQQGATVAAHQPIIIMESMKMEMSLSLPNAGRVKEVLCREGQLVEMGAVLVRLEPPVHDHPTA